MINLYFLIYWCTGFCESLVLESPSNRIALLDTNVTFDCLTNTTSAIRWDKLNTNTYKWDSVWNGFDLLNPDERSSYHVTLEKSTVTQRSRLVISSVRLSDSGVFACKEAGQTTKFAAQLVVTSLKSFRFEDRQSSVVTSEDLAFTARHNCSLYDLSSDGSIKRCRLDSLLYNVSTNFVNNKTISDGTTSPVAPVRTTSTLMCTVVINLSGTCKRSRPCDISQCRQSDSGGEVRCATNVPEYSDTCFVTWPFSTGDLSVSTSSQTTTNINGSPSNDSSGPLATSGVIVIVLIAVFFNVIAVAIIATAIVTYMNRAQNALKPAHSAATWSRYDLHAPVAGGVAQTRTRGSQSLSNGSIVLDFSRGSTELLSTTSASAQRRPSHQAVHGAVIYQEMPPVAGSLHTAASRSFGSSAMSVSAGSRVHSHPRSVAEPPSVPTTSEFTLNPYAELLSSYPNATRPRTQQLQQRQPENFAVYADINHNFNNNSFSSNRQSICGADT